MPRTADHTERRRQIYAAVREISAQDGFAAVTVSRTAATAGMSVGLVQHYFPRKEELLVHTHAGVIREIEERIESAVAELETAHERIEAILPKALEELLPLDESRRGESYALLAFSGASLDNPVIEAESVRWQNRLRELIETAVTNGKECGEVEADTDATTAAWEISAVVRGLAWSLYEQPTPDAFHHARTVLADVARRWFPGPCNRVQP